MAGGSLRLPELRDFEKGILFITISSDNTVTTRKVVKLNKV